MGLHSYKSPDSSLDYQLASHRKLFRHRQRKKIKPALGGGARRRSGGGIGSETPLLPWKFRSKDDEEVVSARKLAAGMWQVAAESLPDCFPTMHHSWMPKPRSTMEAATKWDPGYSNVNHFHSLIRHREGEHNATISVAPSLQNELLKARNHIQKLEAERWRSRKRLKHFVTKLNEERTVWMRREWQKMQAVIDNLKDELRRERRNGKQLNVVNSKLLIDLADSNVCSKRYMLDYEKERKSREMMEDVCNELAKKIEEDRAEIESLKSEIARLLEEVEEERIMLQTAEAWREERVQMKLIDAKIILEEKHCLMSNLISDLESFLGSNNITMDMIEYSGAKVVKEIADSLNIQGTVDFSSEFPISNDHTYATSEGPRIAEAKKWGITRCIGYSSPCSSYELQSVVTEPRRPARNTSSECLNGLICHDDNCKDKSCMETLTQAEDQFSNYTLGGSERSVCGTADKDSQDFETCEISSVYQKQSNKKGSSGCKLLRSSRNNHDFSKKISLDENERLPNGSTSNVEIVSSENVSGTERALDHDYFLNQCRSAGPRNPHIARAMKGCIEWPRGIPRHGLKSKLLEARFESQKSQMRNILKSKS